MFSLGSIIVFKCGKYDGAHIEPQYSEAEAEGSLGAWDQDGHYAEFKERLGMHSGTCSKVTNANNVKKLFWIEMTLDLHGSS